MGFRLSILFLSLAIVFGLCGTGMAQDQSTISDWKTTPNITIKTFDQNDGLPVVALTNMTFGADNHLYVGSFGGLARFNGSKFELISTEEYPELQSNRIIDLKAAPDSSVWMLDEEFRISRWKAGGLESYPSLTKVNDQRINDIVWWSLKFTPSGIAWIIDRNQRVHVYKQGQRFQPAGFQSEYPAIAIEAIDHESVWVLNEEGLHKMKKDVQTLVVPVNELPGEVNDLTRLLWLESGKLIIANYQNVTMYDPADGSLYNYVFEGIKNKLRAGFLQIDESHFRLNFFEENYFFEYTDSTLREVSIPDLVKGRKYESSSLSNRIFNVEYNTLYDYSSNSIIYDTGSDTEINEVLQDAEGNLWVTTGGEGLKRISLSPFQVINPSFGLAAENAYSIVEDSNQSIWIETLNAGVNRLSGNRIDYWIIENEDNPVFLRSLYVKKDKSVFASSYGNFITRFNGSTWEKYPLADSVTTASPSFLVESYYEDEDRGFWLGTQNGLLHRPSRAQFFAEELTDAGAHIPYVRVISGDEYGRIWFGSHGQGLFVRENGIQQIITDPSFPIHIRDIFTERKDTLWLATENHGLTRVLLTKDHDKDVQVISYSSLTKADGLPDIGVHRILPDSYGYFWLTSNQGLSRVNEQQLNDYLDGAISHLWIQNFTEEAGLPIREMNGGVQSSGIVASDSSIWVPSQKGVINFDPASFLDKNPYATTEINISSIRSPQGEYSLYGENSFTVSTSERTLNIVVNLLHYSSPENLHIEYEIPSLKTGWQLLPGDLQVSMTNIPPGTHRINMRLAGVPQPMHAGTSFDLEVPPYFYEQTWFNVVIGVIIAGIVMMGFVFTIRASKRRERILNDKVVERTQLLEEQKSETEKALTTVQEQAQELEKLNKVKTDFFINITHELRTPLALIKGPLGLLKDAADSRKKINREEQLGLIERNSNRLNNLVDHLLNLLRMETGQIREEVTAIDLVEFSRYMTAQFESSEQMNGKSLHIHQLSDRALILADRNSLESIIGNLISNAIKYTRPGDSIDIYTGIKDEHIIFEIRDTGIGISKEDQEHIFNPFFRAKGTENVHGSGIGLSIVKRYMEQIGGNVYIDSELEKGTVVRLLFPDRGQATLVNGNQKPSAVYKQEEEHHTVPVDSAKSPVPETEATLLVVDDNEDLRIFFTRLLEEHYTVITAENGEAALEVMENRIPDLILSDVMMPGIDGIELVEKVRSKKELELIPIIILSAKKTDSSITQGLKAGAQVYLTKPVDNEILLAQVEALISRESRAKELKSKTQQELTSSEQEFVNQIDELILRHLSEPSLSVQGIAEALYISESTLYRKWKKVSDYNLNEYILRTRLQESIMMIEEKGLSFTEASAICGFSHLPHFSKAFKKYYHTTPTKYFKTKE